MLIYANSPVTVCTNLVTQFIFSHLWNYCSHCNLWQGKVEAVVHQFDGQGLLPRPIALVMAGANLYSRDNVHSKSGWNAKNISSIIKHLWYDTDSGNPNYFKNKTVFGLYSKPGLLLTGLRLTAWAMTLPLGKVNSDNDWHYGKIIMRNSGISCTVPSCDFYRFTIHNLKRLF